MRFRFAFLLVFILFFVLATISISAYAQIVTDGLVSYWTFNDADIKGNTLEDTWGGNDGTIMGAPKIVDGKVGQALSFNGAGDYVVVANNDSLKPPLYTIEVWINLSAPQAAFNHGNWVLTKEISGAGYGMAIGLQKPGIYQSDGTIWHRVDANVDLGVGEWHHVAGTYDGKTLSIYVDGLLDNSQEYKFVNSNCPLGFGAWNTAAPSRFFNGIIDEVRIYSRDLSEDELDRNMKAGGAFISVTVNDGLTLTWGEIKASR